MDDRTWFDKAIEITKNMRENQQKESQMIETFSNMKKHLDELLKHSFDMVKCEKEKGTSISEFEQQWKSHMEIIKKFKQKIDKFNIKLQEQIILNIKFQQQSQVELAESFGMENNNT